MIEKHFSATGSPLAEKILAEFDTYLQRFKKIIPNDYSKMMSLIASYEEKGFNYDQSVMEAFNAVQGGN